MENASLQIFFKCPIPTIIFGHAAKPSRCARFWPLRLPRQTTSERPKVVRACGVFQILTSKCASHHKGVHFFDSATSISAPKLRCFYKCNPSQEINAWTSQQLWWTCLLYCACHGKCIFADLRQMPHAYHHFWTCCKTLTLCSLLALAPATPNDIWTSKSGPSMRCFSHFDFEMCFAPHGSALFRQRNFYKCSEAEVLLAFSLANVLRATTACTFSTSQLQLDDGWPESVQEQGLLLLVWRHNITNNMLKMCYRQSRRGVSRQNSRSARR